MQEAIKEHREGQITLENPRPKVLGYLRYKLGYGPGPDGLRRFKEETDALSLIDQLVLLCAADAELSAGETY